MPNWEELRKLIPKGALGESENLGAKALGSSEQGLGGKVMHAMGAPQRYMMNQAAGAMGVKGNPDNSEESSQNIIEGLAGKMGIPEDSTIGNAAKAAGVAGLEVFGDPLSMLPMGKMAGMAGKIPGIAAVGEKVVEKFPQVQKLFKVGEQSFNARSTEEALRVKKALEDAGKVPMDRPLQIITEGLPFRR